ncbi:hypothetical protein ACKGJI_03810 [Sulfurospirillum sp. 1307]|jgi:hypothetical protein
MYKFLATFMILISLTACSTTINPYEKPTDTIHEQALSASQKVVLKKDGIIKAYITVTHLNEIKNDMIKNSDENEVFLVGVYFTKEQVKNAKNEVKIEINSDKNTKNQTLKETDKLIGLIPFKNKWTHYFLVSTQKNREKRGNSIEITIKDIGSKKLFFYDDYGNLATS